MSLTATLGSLPSFCCQFLSEARYCTLCLPTGSGPCILSMKYPRAVTRPVTWREKDTTSTSHPFLSVTTALRWYSMHLTLVAIPHTLLNYRMPPPEELYQAFHCTVAILKPFALVMVWWWWRRLGLFPSGIKSARFDRLQSYYRTDDLTSMAGCDMKSCKLIIKNQQISLCHDNTKYFSKFPFDACPLLSNRCNGISISSSYVRMGQLVWVRC